MSERNTVVGVVLGITALAVLVPVLIQMKTDGRRFRDVWGHFVFVGGLLAVAAGYAFFEDRRQQSLAVGGLIAALFGLFVQHRDREAERDMRGSDDDHTD